MDKTNHTIQGYCIGCSTDPICPVTNFIGNDLAFIKYDIQLNCMNAVSFGNGYFCTCKERINYFKNFKK